MDQALEISQVKFPRQRDLPTASIYGSWLILPRFIAKNNYVDEIEYLRGQQLYTWSKVHGASVVCNMKENTSYYRFQISYFLARMLLLN